MRIGIFGGSFNPVHNGHLKLADFAFSKFRLDRIIFVPSHRTPLKEKEALPPAFRARLLRKALRKRAGCSVSLCEIKRKGLSYTVDTLRYFKKRLPGENEFYFLAGQDVLKNLSRWKSVREIFRLCRFVVFSRPGAARRRAPAAVRFAPFDALGISASDIRRRLESGKSVKRLVPAVIEKDLKNYFGRTRSTRIQK